MKLFKKILTCLLATQIIFSTSPVLAEDKNSNAVTVNAKEFRVEFDKIVYSIETIPQVVNEFERYHQMAAANGMSESVMKTMFDRMSAAIDLMSVIYADVSLNKEERREMLKSLYKAIGSLVMQVVYNEGEDFPKEELEKRMAKGSSLTVATARELRLDFMSLFTFRRTANREFVWRPTDRANRDELAQNMIQDLEQFARDVYPTLPEGQGTREWTKVVWAQEDAQSRGQSFANSMINLRQARTQAQKNAVAIYLGMSFVAFFFPLVDFTGAIETMIEGSRSDNSVLLSATAYASIWLTAGLIKAKTNSSKTLQALKSFKETMLNPEAKTQLSEELIEKREGFAKRLITGVGQRCRLMFGGKGKAISN